MLMRVLPVLALLLLAACSSTAADPTAFREVQVTPFGRTKDGAKIEMYTLTNNNQVTAKLITLGASLTELHVPNRRGEVADIVLGFDQLAGYESNPAYFGCTTGRVANRIANGRFWLDGVEYGLATNNGPNHLHGGVQALHKVVWRGEPTRAADGSGVRFRYLSRDGEEGYPGNLAITVTYVLTNANELRIEYEATTDQPTPVNLTHHSYFNLAGIGDILGHELTITAERYTPTDANLIPTGELAPVAGTPFDFRKPQAIGTRIAQVPGGYDLNYVLDQPRPGQLLLAATLRDPASGRQMEIWTTEPGLQFYSGNFLDGSLTGKQGVKYGKHGGLCLEAQHFPDSVNRPEFPAVILEPGATYRQVTVHKFKTE